jgi:hypothetical protein
VEKKRLEDLIVRLYDFMLPEGLRRNGKGAIGPLIYSIARIKR